VAGGPWWNPILKGARHSIVAAPAAQHATIMELLASARVRPEQRRDAPRVGVAAER
jgi:hypothetical protein